MPIARRLGGWQSPHAPRGFEIRFEVALEPSRSLIGLCTKECTSTLTGNMVTLT